MFKKILVPTDASEYSQRAFRAALELARAMNGEIRLLHVVYNPDFFWGFNSPYGETKSDQEVDKNAELLLEATIAGVEVDVPLQKALRKGHPVQAIVQEIKQQGIDLVVMGSHGYGMFTGSVLGSVSQRVIHDTNCPVMIVK